MKRLSQDIPLLGFIGWSGSGKTTLLAKLIAILRGRGLRIAVVKNTHHDLEIDLPGKDSYILRQAGANQVLITGRNRWALISETPELAEPDLSELLTHLDYTHLDWIFVEGFKHFPFPCIEVHRPSCARSLLFPEYPQIIAIACDAQLTIPCSLPILNLNDPPSIVKFILEMRPVENKSPFSPK